MYAPSPNSALKSDDVPAPRGCSRGHVGPYPEPGSALQPPWPQARSQQDTKPIPDPGAVLETPRGSTAVYREHVPHPSSSQRTQDAVLRADTQPRELEQAVYGNLPRAKSFNLLLFFFFFLLFKRYLFHVRWSRAVLPLLLCPQCTQGGGTGVAVLREVFFASTITQTVTSFTRKHWQVPRFGSNLFLCGPRARGYLILLLHHTCPSASSPSAPEVFGCFSQAAFPAVFSAPVLLAASCQTANKTH